MGKFILSGAFVLSLCLMTGNAIAQNATPPASTIPNGVDAKGSEERSRDVLAAKVETLEKDVVIIRKQYTSLSEKLPTVAWYAQPLLTAVLSFLATLAGAWMGYIITRHFAQRAEDRADTQHRQDMAIALSKEWRDMHKAIAEAKGALEAPESLKENEHYNKVIAYGDWFDLLSERWNRDLIDTEYLRSAGMLGHMREFITSVEAAQSALKGTSVGRDLSRDVPKWRALHKVLGNNPKA